MGVLDGRVALITGAGQGVGRGMALALAAEGVAVAVAGRTKAKCDTVVEEIVDRGGRAMAIGIDVKDPDAVIDCVAQVVAEQGALHILVNNAQEVARGSLLGVDEAAVQAGWESGPLATLRFMRAAHSHLRGDGVIINLASRAGVKTDPVNCGAYAAVKEAIRALTRSAAWEWADDGIRTYAIMPLADSPALARLQQDEPEVYQRSLAAIPQHRFGDPETDIGRVVVFLCGPDAGYLTGITIPIDGGAAHLG